MADEERAYPLAEKDLPPRSNGTGSVSLSLRDRAINVQCILLNTFSTVTIVFLNKAIFSDEQLKHCQILVAIWHFIATFGVLYVATLPPFHAFEAVRLPLKQMIPISAFFAGFLLLGNLSLAFNSVGFYQLAKVMTTPAVVLLNFLLFRKTISLRMLCAIAAVCVGVSLTNSKAALGNPVGTFIATLAFIVTALYQIWIGKKITDLAVSAPQLLLNQAPVSVVLLAVVCPFVDTVPDVSKIPSNVLLTLFASGLLAALLNLSQFLIIGRTSALTFNIVSNLKTIMIVSLSWWQEGRIPTMQDSIGVAVALGGAYAYAQMSAKKR
jgi:solute carrier family 35 protein E3